jgi:hypothetical protein
MQPEPARKGRGKTAFVQFYNSEQAQVQAEEEPREVRLPVMLGVSMSARKLGFQKHSRINP